MRIPSYLSPTALSVWKTDQEQYYMQYLAERRPPAIPQTEPMAAGSAFDAYVKNYLFGVCYGNGHPLAAQFDLESIFKNQVEEHNRDWALKAGEELFKLYEKCGALADLLKMMESSLSGPRFEFAVRGEVEGVPLLGKPDIWFVNKEGAHVIFDFKVNGYVGGGRSPTAGYTRLYNPIEGCHRKAQILKERGIEINCACYLNDADKSWGAQLSTYGWLMGEPVGWAFVVAIDQLYRSRAGTMRVATHRCWISEKFQQELILEYRRLWEIINSGWIFRTLPKEESLRRQAMLDEVATAYDGTDELAEFLKETRG